MALIHGAYTLLLVMYKLFLTVLSSQWINLVIPVVILIGVLGILVTSVRIHSSMLENKNDMSIMGKLFVSFIAVSNHDLARFFHVQMATRHLLNAYHTMIKYTYKPTNAHLSRTCFNSITMRSPAGPPVKIPFPEACCWIGRYHGSKDIVVFFHGGGYLTGNPHQAYMADHIYTEMNRLFYKNVDVLAIDYKKLPKYKYPTAINETFEIYRQFTIHFPSKHFHFIGSSAGANLAVNVVKLVIETNLNTNKASDANKTNLNSTSTSTSTITSTSPIPIPKSMVLWSPWAMTLDHHPDVLDTISRPLVHMMVKSYYGNQYRTLAVQRSLVGFDYSAFPPTLVHYGDEYLEPEIVAFVRSFQRTNPTIQARKHPGLSHAYHMLYIFSNSIQQDCIDSYKFVIQHFS